MSFFSNAKKIWTTYAIILASLAAALGWFSYTTVRLDLQVELNRRQIELAEKQALQRERINYALWRMDWLLTPLVAQEAARNHWMYEALIPFDAGVNWKDSTDRNQEDQIRKGQAQFEARRQIQADQVEVPQQSDASMPAEGIKSKASEPRKVTSPLVMRSSPWVKLHFQVDENNQFSSPQVPSTEAFQVACSAGLITDKDLDVNQGNLNKVASELQYPALLAACSEQNLPEFDHSEMIRAGQMGETAQESQTLSSQAANGFELFDNKLKGIKELKKFEKSQQSLPVAKGGKLTDYSNRAATANQFALSQRLNSWASQFDAPLEQKVVEGVMRAIWLQDKLLLARRVQRDGKSFIQCCWLDWDEIKKSLLSEIEDIVPNADLVPRKNDATVDSNRALATLPVDLRIASVKRSDSEGRVGEGRAVEDREGKESPISNDANRQLTAKPDSFSAFQPVLGDTLVDPPKLSRAAYRSLVIAWGGFVLAALSTAWLIAGVIQLSERRSAFASAVTHELRTPLTTFRLYSEMLDGDMITDPEQRQAYTKGLVVEADRLTRLVENVLQFSRLERKQTAFRLDSLRALDLLNEMLQRCHPRMASANLDFETSFAKELADVQIVTSRDSVEQIFSNLIDNACKYAATGKLGKIIVDAELEKRWLVVRVRDFGPGIDVKMIGRLFRPFARSSDETAGTASGVGLGLSLSRQLAKQVGGRLDYRPAHPGCQFELRLPRS